MRQPSGVLKPSARVPCSGTVVFAAVLLGCSAPVRPVIGELTFLGLQGESITALVETPWGLFAGTRRSGIYRYQPDSARQWRALGLTHAVVSAILFVPSSPPRLLVGVRPEADESTAAAVFASEDRGETWIPWDGGLSARYGNREWAYALAIDPGDPNRLFMGQSISILRSEDAGRTWEYVLGNQDVSGMGVSTIVVSPLRNGYVFAGATSAFFTPVVYRSSDWGASWEVVRPISGAENSITALAVDPSRPKRLLAGVFGGVTSSDDEGNTWLTLLRKPDLLVTSVLATGGAIYAVGGTIQESPLAVPPLALYRSTDGGSTWRAVLTASDPGGSDVAALDSQGRLLIGTTARSRGGVWRLELK